MSRIQPKPIGKYPWYLRALFRLQKRKYGKILLPVLIWGRCPQIFRAFLTMYNRFNAKNALIDPQLRSLVMVKVSQDNHCPFCVDMNSQLFIDNGGSVDKLKDTSSYADSPLFSKKEKVALAYAEAVSSTHLSVDDNLFSELKELYNEDEIVELTALIAFQNMSSKFNAALQIPSQGLYKNRDSQ